MKTFIEINRGSEPTVMSYEEAFGDYGQEYSEARGRGRRRRQANRLERIKNRKEVALAKRDLRQSKQQAKIEQRRSAMESRQNIKTERKRTKQERRNEQQAFRQGRRDTALQSRQARRDYAKTARVNRRNIGNEEDSYEEPNVDNTQMGGVDQSQYDDTQMGGAYDDTQMGGAYDDTQMGGAYDDTQDYENGSSYDEASDVAPDDNYAEETPELNEENTEEYGFDGELEAEFSNQDGNIIDIESMPIYKTALKVEQNKERIEQLKCMPPSKDVNNEIEKRTIIVSNLEGQIDEYSNANGKNVGLTLLAQRKAKLKRLEHKNKDGKLDEVIARQKESIAKLEARISGKKSIKNKLTKVDPKLNATIKPNNIVIPPQTSNASGGDVIVDIEDNFNACGCSTGFDGGEFDMERGSFATGDSKNSSLSNVNWTAIAIGVGVSALLIFGAERMKLFGSK